MGRILDYVWRPTVFFEAQLRAAPDWWVAMAGPILCGLLSGIASTIFGHALREAQVDVLRHLGLSGVALPSPALMSIVVTLSYPAWFGMAVLALLSFNVLYKDSAKPARVAEFTGTCFMTQIPFCALTIVLAALFVPEPFRPRSGADRVDTALAFADAQISSPVLSVIRVLSYVSTCWLVSQLTFSFKAAGDLSTKAAVVAGLWLAFLFGGMRFISDHL